MALDSTPNNIYRVLALAGVSASNVKRGDGVPLMDLVDPEVIQEVQEELAQHAQQALDQLGDDWHQGDEIEGAF